METARKRLQQLNLKLGPQKGTFDGHEREDGATS